MKFLRLGLFVLFAFGFLGLLVENAEARTRSRCSTFCVPTPYYYGPTVSLIAKDSLAGWTASGGGEQRGGWSVIDGVLHLQGKGGDLVTEREYENFVLDFEWTSVKGTNSGIKYRFKKFDGKGWLGLEYQVLDDARMPEGLKPKNCTASLYDILPPTATTLKPVGQVNKGRIVVNGNRIEHWLNGKKVMSTTVGSDEWNEGIAASKFKGIEGFGENNVGFIMVQDHNTEVWFHKITIREILQKPVARKCVVRLRSR